MSKIEVNTIEPQCGTTLTLGASGDTVTLASGASQSGFGRTGTVNWQTGSIKTGDFTAANGEGYFVDTNSGAVTATLPSSPSAGSIVAFKDYKSTFSTNALTIDRNSSKINGTTDNAIISASGSHISMVYVDATQGWLAINDNTTSIGDEFIVATGGTITTCGNFKTHTFTGPGTFTVSCLATSPANNAVEYVVVAGGGGGGGSDNSGSSGRESGGGGAGGFRSFTALSCASSKNAANGLTVTATAFPITIGGGGAGSIGGGCDPTRRGCSGSNSIFSTITSAGGGGGGSGFDNCTPARAGGDGGNGGGSGAEPIAGGGTIGSGNSPSTTPPQGENGGEGGHVPGNWAAGGGGGGAGAVGTDAANPGTPGIGQGGSGGVGGFVPSGFGTPSPLRFPGPVPGAHYFAGGGGGGSMYSSPTAGVGGSGGGGAGGSGPPGADRAPGSGTANSGGGGGGQGRSSPSNTSGSGGSGIVMIRYKFQ